MDGRGIIGAFLSAGCRIGDMLYKIWIAVDFLKCHILQSISSMRQPLIIYITPAAKYRSRLRRANLPMQGGSGMKRVFVFALAMIFKFSDNILFSPNKSENKTKCNKK